MDALIIIDLQNDFCPGGALAVQDGDAVIEPINRLAKQSPLVIATRDWHPPDHSSFTTHGGRWPVHCVYDTPGAQFHPGIHADLIDVVIDKGQSSETEGYSAFEATGLAELLRERGVDEVHLAGLALDYCVKATAIDAREQGFEVVVHEDATRAVEAQPGDAENALTELRKAGVKTVR
jgi:nicotinamidase/pyrazinamidase